MHNPRYPGGDYGGMDTNPHFRRGGSNSYRGRAGNMANQNRFDNIREERNFERRGGRQRFGRRGADKFNRGNNRQGQHWQKRTWHEKEPAVGVKTEEETDERVVSLAMKKYAPVAGNQKQHLSVSAECAESKEMDVSVKSTLEGKKALQKGDNDSGDDAISLYAESDTDLTEFQGNMDTQVDEQTELKVTLAGDSRSVKRGAQEDGKKIDVDDIEGESIGLAINEVISGVDDIKEHSQTGKNKPTVFQEKATTRNVKKQCVNRGGKTFYGNRIRGEYQDHFSPKSQAALKSKFNISEKNKRQAMSRNRRSPPPTVSRYIGLLPTPYKNIGQQNRLDPAQIASNVMSQLLSKSLPRPDMLGRGPVAIPPQGMQPSRQFDSPNRRPFVGPPQGAPQVNRGPEKTTLPPPRVVASQSTFQPAQRGTSQTSLLPSPRLIQQTLQTSSQHPVLPDPSVLVSHPLQSTTTTDWASHAKKTLLPTPDTDTAMARLLREAEMKNFTAVVHLARDALATKSRPGLGGSDTGSRQLTEAGLADLLLKVCRQGGQDYVLTLARLIPLPSALLLEALALCADEFPGQLMAVENEVWMIFNKVLVTSPEESSITAFIRCFSAFGSWSRVWKGLQHYSCGRLSPSLLSLCLPSLIMAPEDSGLSNFLPLAVRFVGQLTPDEVGGLASEVAALWLECVSKGKLDLAGQISGSSFVPAVKEQIQKSLSSRIMEWILGERVNALLHLLLAGFEMMDDMSDSFQRGFIMLDKPVVVFTSLVDAILKSSPEHCRPGHNYFLALVGNRILQSIAEQAQWQEAWILVSGLTQRQIPIDTVPNAVVMVTFEVACKVGQWVLAANIVRNSPSLRQPMKDAIGVKRHSLLLNDLTIGLANQGSFQDAGEIMWVILNIIAQDETGIDKSCLDPQKLLNDYIVTCCRSQKPGVLAIGIDLVKKAWTLNDQHHLRINVRPFTIRILLVMGCRSKIVKNDVVTFVEKCILAKIFKEIDISQMLLMIPTDAASEEVNVLLLLYCRHMKENLVNMIGSGRQEAILDQCELVIAPDAVGNRDPQFLQTFGIDNTAQGLIDRVEGVLKAPAFLHCPLEYKKECSGGQFYLKIHNFSLYNCVYYSDLD